MSDSFPGVDYGEQLVARYRASGLTRKEFAVRADISVSTLGYYLRRERKASPSAAVAPSRILPVEFVVPEEAAAQASAPVGFGGIRIRLANGRLLEVERGFDAQLLREVLAVLEANRGEERA